MFEIIIELVREFNPLTVMLIVFVTLILLGSIVVEYKDGNVRFSYRWSGLRRAQRRESKKDKADEKNIGILTKIASAFIRGYHDE